MAMQAVYGSMDDAPEILSAYGPDLHNGLTSHAPMAAEALCAMGRADAVLPWVERYRAGILPRPATREPITRANWRGALAQCDRTADSSAFFAAELREAPWRTVLNQWAGRLAPGICASAAHGVIRVGHAARSLGESESSLRLRQLADGLGYWAANYQELPTSTGTGGGLAPHDGIRRVVLLPPPQRVFSGTIVSSLEALSGFPQFAPVIGLLDVSGDATALVSQQTEVFARVFLTNTHDLLTAIVFVHGVTSIAALGNLLPYLDAATTRAALRFAWQASCGLYTGPTHLRPRRLSRRAKTPKCWSTWPLPTATSTRSNSLKRVCAPTR